MVGVAVGWELARELGDTERDPTDTGGD
jgi:hypothetical protein